MFQRFLFVHIDDDGPPGNKGSDSKTLVPLILNECLPAAKKCLWKLLFMRGILSLNANEQFWCLFFAVSKLL